MFTTRSAAATGFFALAITFAPDARAQGPADSTARPTINPLIARSVSVPDSLRFPAMSTRRVWDVQGGGRRQSVAHDAVVGGVVGAVLGGLVGAGLGAGFCDAADCSDAWREGALGGVLLGGATGAVIGALIGFVW